MKKLLLVDGHALAYRAYYAMPPLSNSSGQSTQAVLGIANMIFRILKEEKPSHMIVFFDRETPQFRLDLYPEYKAQRPEPPSDFISQLPLIKEFFQALQVPVVEEAGFEADDGIATVTKRAEQEGFQVSILSGDLDMLQLVNEKTEVLAGKKGISDLTRYTVEEVKKRYALEPAQLIDLKALSGDSSDNIKGAPGLGPKSAAKLLQTWNTLENLLAHTDALTPKTRENIEAAKEKILNNKTLVTLRTDTPFSLTWENCALSYENNPDALRNFLERMEFNQLITRLGLQPQIEVKTVEFEFADTDEKAGSLLQKFQACDQAALALRLSESFLAIHLKDAGTWAIPPENTVNVMRELISQSQGKSVTVYDWKAFHHFFIKNNLPAPAWNVLDVSLAAWLCNSNNTNPVLSDLSREYLKQPLPDIKDNPAAAPANEAAILPELGAELNVKMQALGLESLYQKVELPLTEVLARMEHRGVKMDLFYLHRVSEEFKQELARLEKEIHAAAGAAFNINSSKQLAKVLYEDLKLPTGRKQKTGYSTDVDELERLQEHSPIAANLLQYRILAKLQNTYVDVFPKIVNPHTGRIHTTYLQTGTATGRFASKDPNLQNIPIRTLYGQKIRRAFIPGKPGWKLLSADYSQIELRLLAHFSKDPVLLETFQNHEDVHSRTAMEIFNVQKQDITSEMRRMAKIVNFGIIYGMTEYGLSQSLEMNKEEAQQYIKTYLERLPNVSAYIQASLETARQEGVTRTLFGRLRAVPELFNQNLFRRQQGERIAINAPLQGSSADLIKLAMIQLEEKLKIQQLEGQMLLQVHDELVFEVPESHLENFSRLVKETMENVVKLDVPLVVDLSSGDNWADT